MPKNAALDAALAKFLPRCRIDEDAGCTVWTGAFSFGICRAQMNDADGKLRMVNIRRLILEAKTGQQLGKRLASCRCGNERCIAPAHLIAMTRAAVQQRSSKQGLLSQPHVRAAKIAAGRKRASVTMTIARDIRSAVAAGEAQATVAARHGLTQSTVWKVVHNHIAAEAANGSSVFNWRPAA